MICLSDQEAKLAATLSEAAKSGRLADPTPSLAPADAASAMRVQGHVVAELGDDILGWKVGFLPDGAVFAAPLISSRMPARPFRWSDQSGADFRIEVEIGVRLAKDLPIRLDKPYSRQEIINAIDTVFCGVELLSSRYSSSDNLTFLQGLADCFHNGCYILGTEKKTNEIPGPLEQMLCRVTLDGAVLFNTAPKHPQNDILLPVITYANNQNDTLGGLKANHIITTGSLSGVITSSTGGTLVVNLSGFEEIVLELKKT